MKRLLAVIENDMYMRNFITSGAFNLLLAAPEFGIAIASNVSKLRTAVPEDKIVGVYDRNMTNINLIYNFNQVSMRALRHKSTTFDIKAQVNWFGPSNPNIFKPTYTLQEMNNIRQQILKNFQPNLSLESIVVSERPEVVVFPVTGVEATGTELVLLSRKYGFNTLFLVNGWDNLSSKGVFPLLPDDLGVWGPQSLLDAIDIQGMRPERVHQLGCARYEDYLQPQRARQRLFDFPYVLFAGSCTPHDEISALRRLDEVLTEMGENQLKIVYRPHPWRNQRQCFDVFEPGAYRHTILDPQVADNYFKEKSCGTESCSSQNYPALDYYPSLVNHAAFVISPMSSMLLEAALFDVPALVLAYDDGVHPIPASAQAGFKHFEGADEVPGWHFIRRFYEMEQAMRCMVERFKTESPDQRYYHPALSHAMKRYLHADGYSYAQRLLFTLDLILARRERQAERTGGAAARPGVQEALLA